MAFGPIIGGGGSGGGGSGFAPVTITGTTASIDESDAADLDIAAPEGADTVFVVAARIIRLDGASQLASVAVHTNAARSDTAAHLFGDNFGGADVPDGNPVRGPLVPVPGGTFGRAGMSIPVDSGQIRLVVYNRDFAEASAYRVELDVIPVTGA